MTDMHLLAAYVAAASILTITPGVDTAMVLRSAAAGGPRAGLTAAVGISTGCLLWGAAIATGLGALLTASTFAYTVLKCAGSVYLLWLGTRLLLLPRDGFAAAQDGDIRLNADQSFRHGFLTNILNPKIGIFYVTFLPQFIPAGANITNYSLMLSAIHVGIGLVWFAGLITASVPLRRFLQQPRTTKILDRATGSVFLLFGARLAFSK